MASGEPLAIDRTALVPQQDVGPSVAVACVLARQQAAQGASVQEALRRVGVSRPVPVAVDLVVEVGALRFARHHDRDNFAAGE